MVRTLEDILITLGTEKPFLDEMEKREDGTCQPFTSKGARAYETLTSILYCVGDLVEEKEIMNRIVERLDNIADMDQ